MYPEFNQMLSTLIPILALFACSEDKKNTVDVTRPPDKYYLSHVRLDESGEVIGVAKPRREQLAPLTQSEALIKRGTIRDAFGTPTTHEVEGVGQVPIEPWLGLVGTRTVWDAPVKEDHPEYGTKTKTSYSLLERFFNPQLAGLYTPEEPWADAWHRLDGDPREGGADVYLTLQLPVMRELAQAAYDEAFRLATAAKKLGPSRQKAEHRDGARECRAWDVDAAITASDGAILAVITAVGQIDDDDNVFVTFETNEPGSRVECLPKFQGPLRAMSEPVLVGSEGKVLPAALAVDVAQRGGPFLQFEERDGDLWMKNLGDPENADPTGAYLADHGEITSLYGQDVLDCHDHRDEFGSGPIRLVENLAFSRNSSFCTMASAVQLSGPFLEAAFTTMGLVGPTDLLPELGVPLLDRARLPLREPIAIGGTSEVMRDGTVSVMESSQVALSRGIMPTTLWMTGVVRMIGNDGVWTPPYLFMGVRQANGTVSRYTPGPGTRIVSPLAAGWVKKGLHATVELDGATGTAAMKGMTPWRLAELGLKTGTAFPQDHGVTLPSPKAAIAVYPLSSPTPFSIAVWCRFASNVSNGTPTLDDQAALRVVRQVIESGVLDQIGPVASAAPAPKAQP